MLRYSRALALVAAVGAVCTGASSAGAARFPRPAHTIVIVEENKTLEQIEGNASAPFINAMARHGALFVHAFGVTPPSLPNYFALFAGVTNDNGDDCPATGFSANLPNLASELLAKHLSFGGYAEGLPDTGSTVCAAGSYARKHVPWVAFSNVPKSASEPLDDLPRYDALPTVAFIIPDVDDDMHDGTIVQTRFPRFSTDRWCARDVIRSASITTTSCVPSRTSTVSRARAVPPRLRRSPTFGNRLAAVGGDVGERLSEPRQDRIAVDFKKRRRIAGVSPVFREPEGIAGGSGKSR